MKVYSSKKFVKKYRNLPLRIQEKFDNQILLFVENQFDKRLNNHPLQGKLRGYRSIDVTGDIRAVFRDLDESSIFFITIGSHSKLYG